MANYGINSKFSFPKEFDIILKKRLNREMGQYCLQLFLRNYTKEGYLDGNGVFTKWKPLSKKYESYKELKYPGMPIGVATADLKKSFNLTFTDNGFDITNNSEYAEFFHKERPIIYADSSVDKKMVKFIDDEMQKIFAQTHKNLKQ